VAEHCIRASYINPEKFPLEKLLHDRAETWLVDLPRPLKYSPFMWVYKFYEKLAEKVSGEKFGLNTSKIAEHEVKRVDKIMLVTEKRDLFAQDRVMCLNKMDDAEGVQGLPEKIVPWTPGQAKRAFLMRYYELTGQKQFYCSGIPHFYQRWLKNEFVDAL
jgi:5'-deoxynucleotidase YfbR-like HD superfamily hydrolase